MASNAHCNPLFGPAGFAAQKDLDIQEEDISGGQSPFHSKEVSHQSCIDSVVQNSPKPVLAPPIHGQGILHTDYAIKKPLYEPLKLVFSQQKFTGGGQLRLEPAQNLDQNAQPGGLRKASKNMKTTPNARTYSQHLSGKINKARPDEMIINVDEYNTLKQRLENAVKLNSFLESSGSLWKAECAWLK